METTTQAKAIADTGDSLGRWLTIDDACAVAGVSRRTIYNWMDHGRLQTKRTAGGRVRIFEDSLFRPDRGSAA